MPLDHGAAAEHLTERFPRAVGLAEPPDDAVGRAALSGRRHELGRVVAGAQRRELDKHLAVCCLLAVDHEPDLEQATVDDGEARAELLLQDPAPLADLVTRPEVELALFVPLLLFS